MKRPLAVGKYINSSLLLLALTGLATAATLQSHPFSQIFPPDEDLGFGGKDIKNVSRVETAVIAANRSDLSFKSDADVTVLRYDESQSRWELVNSDIYLEGNLDMNGNRIMDVSAPSGPGDAVNKSYVDRSDDTIADDQSLSDVLSRGNSAGSYSIDMNSNPVTGLADPTDQQDAATKNYVDNRDHTDDQSLSIDVSGTDDTISLDNGGSVTIDDDTGTDDQELSVSTDVSGTSDEISIDNGNTITIDDDYAADDQDIQASATGDTVDITIDNGNGASATIEDNSAATECTGGEYLAGDGTCNTDSYAADDQNLNEVLTSGNSASDQDITDVNTLYANSLADADGGDEILMNSDLDMNGQGFRLPVGSDAWN